MSKLSLRDIIIGLSPSKSMLRKKVILKSGAREVTNPEPFFLKPMHLPKQDQGILTTSLGIKTLTKRVLLFTMSASRIKRGRHLTSSKEEG
jgi:hypothetical protein